MPYQKKSKQNTAKGDKVSLGIKEDPVPYYKLVVTDKPSFKFILEIKSTVIVIIQMPDTDGNKKLNGQFLPAFTAGFIMGPELFHGLKIQFFIDECRYVTFKFLTVQRTSKRPDRSFFHAKYLLKAHLSKHSLFYYKNRKINRKNRSQECSIFKEF